MTVVIQKLTKRINDVLSRIEQEKTSLSQIPLIEHGKSSDKIDSSEKYDFDTQNDKSEGDDTALEEDALVHQGQNICRSRRNMTETFRLVKRKFQERVQTISCHIEGKFASFTTDDVLAAFAVCFRISGKTIRTNMEI